MTSHHRFRSGVVYSLAALLALALLATAGAARPVTFGSQRR